MAAGFGKTLSIYFSSGIEVDLKMSARCLSDGQVLLMVLVNHRTEFSAANGLVWTATVSMNSLMCPETLRKTVFCHGFALWTKRQPCWTEFLTVHAYLFWSTLDRSCILKPSQQNLPLKLLDILLLTWTSLTTENACLTF